MLIFCQHPVTSNEPCPSSEPAPLVRSKERRYRQKRCSICLGWGHTKKTCGRPNKVRLRSQGGKKKILRTSSPVLASSTTIQSTDDNAPKSDTEMTPDGISDDENILEEDITAEQDERIDESDENDETGSGNDDLSEDISVETVTIEEAPQPKTRANNFTHVQAYFQPSFKGVGPKEKVPNDIAKDPLAFLQLFLTDRIMTTFVDSSNAYARATKKTVKHKKWWDITINEMWCFIGLILFLGTISIPDRRDFWDVRSKYYNSFIANSMDLYRFEAILSVFHWENTAAYSTQQKHEKSKEDSFYMIEGFLQELCGLFQKYFDCGQDIDVDEQGIPAKCFHTAIQYNKDKPFKWFFKNFCLNDAQTKYLYNFFLYRGKDEQRSSDCPATAHPVLKLSNKEDLFNKGHIMHVDNWFNSPYLAESLFSRGIHCNGTIRKNRISKKFGVRRDWFLPEKATRGQMKGKRVRKGLFSFYLTSWKDSKPVNMLSTFKSYREKCKRNAKTTKDKLYNRLEIDRPTVVRKYNAGMGGTDGIDQLIAMYRSSINTRRWPHRIFFHFFLICVVNAHILYSMKYKLNRNDNFFSTRSFLIKVCEQMVAKHTPSTQEDILVHEPSNFGSEKQRSSTWTRFDSRLQGRHFSVSFTKVDQKRLKITRKRCRNVGCTLQPMTWCLTCKIPLCSVFKDGTTCFEQFHSENHF